MLSVVVYVVLFVGCCLLLCDFVCCRLLFGIHCLLFVVCGLTFLCLLFAGLPLRVACCLLFVVCLLLVCRVLYGR